MKITDVTLTLFAWESIPSTIYGHHTARPTGKSDLGLLAITTDQGLTGHAFLGTSSNPASLDGPGLIRFLKPLLMGQDPLDRERLNRLLWARVRAATVRAIGACDVALWDIAGKAAGLPIHRLIGTTRDHIAAYASSEIHASPEDYVEQARHYQSTGWRAYKIHPPQSWRDDIKVCEAVRKAVGDGRSGSSAFAGSSKVYAVNPRTPPSLIFSGFPGTITPELHTAASASSPSPPLIPRSSILAVVARIGSNRSESLFIVSSSQTSHDVNATVASPSPPAGQSDGPHPPSRR